MSCTRVGMGRRFFIFLPPIFLVFCLFPFRLDWLTLPLAVRLIIPIAMFLSSLATGLSATDQSSASGEDPYLWLEEVTAEKSLEWVKAQNALSTHELCGQPGFETVRQRLLSILDSKERIPTVSQEGEYLYNLRRNPEHPRGLWRRTSLKEYKKAEPNWETVLDLDLLAQADGENWVWKGATFLKPDHDRCLIQLSRGGADARVVREFDLKRKDFVADGFTLPEAKSYVSWRHRDALYVGTDFGPGSLTQSGYPRLVKEWTRGTPLSAAKTVFEGREEDAWVHGTVKHDRLPANTGR